MEIKNINIHNSQINFVEKINSISFSETFPIEKEEFKILKSQLLSLEQGDQKILEGKVRQITNEGDPDTKATLIQELNEFLLSTGIAIGNNISAAIVFESINMMLGL